MHQIRTFGRIANKFNQQLFANIKQLYIEQNTEKRYKFDFESFISLINLADTASGLDNIKIYYSRKYVRNLNYEFLLKFISLVSMDVHNDLDGLLIVDFIKKYENLRFFGYVYKRNSKYFMLKDLELFGSGKNRISRHWRTFILLFKSPYILKSYI